MDKAAMLKRMEELAAEMLGLTNNFDKDPGKLFDKLDTAVMIDPPPGSGGYPKFPAKEIDGTPAAIELQRRWLAISTQLAKKITNPHASIDDIQAVFNGIGMLGKLYIEKFKS